MRRFLAPAFFAAALVLLGVLFFNLHQGRQFSVNLRPKPKPEAFAKPTSTTLVEATQISTSAVTQKPRFTGRDKKGHGWEITADTATQSGTASTTVIILSKVDGTWKDPSNTYALQAQTGEFEESTTQLNLTGGVTAQGMGVSLTAPAMQVNTTDRTAKGEDGIILEGQKGGKILTVTANTFQVNALSGTAVLRGKVHAIWQATY